MWVQQLHRVDIVQMFDMFLSMFHGKKSLVKKWTEMLKSVYFINFYRVNGADQNTVLY